MPECSFCGRRAVHHQRYSGVYRCDRCFKEKVERRFRRTVARDDLISRGDRIAAAVSGGPDSLANLYLLSKYSAYHNVELLALTIDEGIKGYRDGSIPQARRKSESLGLEHLVVSFDEAFGADLDLMSESADDGPHICTCCGVLRRSLLNQAARELGSDKLAIAHNLDDEVQTIMMNYVRGDLSRLSRLGPGYPAREGFVPRIKPLREIPEKEVAIYSILQGLDPHISECPYLGGMRTEVRGFINELELNHPTTKYKILRMFDKIRPNLPASSNEFELSECEICGEPSTTKICRPCELLKELDLERKKKRLISEEKKKIWRRARPGG